MNPVHTRINGLLPANSKPLDNLSSRKIVSITPTFLKDSLAPTQI